MKPSSAKRKGVETENMWADLLGGLLSRKMGRKRTTGREDEGDLYGLEPAWTLECKSSLADLASGLIEAQVEQANARTTWHALLLRIKQRAPKFWAVAMTAEQYAKLVLYIERLERENAVLRQNQQGTIPVIPIEHTRKRGVPA